MFLCRVLKVRVSFFWDFFDWNCLRCIKSEMKVWKKHNIGIWHFINWFHLRPKFCNCLKVSKFKNAAKPIHFVIVTIKLASWMKNLNKYGHEFAMVQEHARWEEGGQGQRQLLDKNRLNNCNNNCNNTCNNNCKCPAGEGVWSQEKEGVGLDNTSCLLFDKKTAFLKANKPIQRYIYVWSRFLY